MDNLCQQYLSMLYHHVNFTKKNKHITETYGEILPQSIDSLLSKIKIGKEDIFLDLGSGLGKVVIQIFLSTPVKEAHGIEILPELHQIAVNTANRVKIQLSELFQNGRNLHFHLGNFLTTPFKTPSILLIGSPCFSPKMLNSLSQMINTLPSIHTVLTLRPLFNLTHLTFIKAVRIECSWDSALCFIYQCPSKTFFIAIP